MAAYWGLTATLNEDLDLRIGEVLGVIIHPLSLLAVDTSYIVHNKKNLNA